MAFHPLMRTRFDAYVERSPEEVMRLLAEDERMQGALRDHTFSFRWKLGSFGNSWEPIIKGHVLPAGEGSVLEAEMAVSPFVKAFTAVHGVLFLGLTWLLASAAFTWHANRAKDDLRTLLGPTVEDPKPLSAIQSTVVRPALDTETHAPWSLRAVMRKTWLGFHPLMQTRFRAYVEKSQEEVLELLAEDERAVGKVGERDFSLRWRVGFTRNSWEPRIKGHVLPAGEGSLIEAEMTVNLFVKAFTAFHGVFFLGLSWLFGAGAFSWHANRAKSDLREMLGPTVEDPNQISEVQATADPTALGAESNAPWSLRTVMRQGEVEFSLDTDGWVGTRTTTLRVDQRGVTVGDTSMTWDELERVEVVLEGDARHLDLVGHTTVSVEANRVPGRDLMWLKDYLRGQDRRLGPSDEELEAARERMRPLNSIRSAQRTVR